MGAYWQQIMCCLLSGQRFEDRVSEIVSDLVGFQDKSSWISANAIQAAGAKPATRGLNGAGFAVYSFADGQEQQVQFNVEIPLEMDRTRACQLCMGWSSPTVSQTLIMDYSYLLTGENEDTEGAATTDTGLAFQSSAVSDGLAVTSVIEIPANTIHEDDVCMHVVLERDGNNVLDTLGAVMELHGISLNYTSKQYGV